jgi:hypothetical protein
MKTLYSLQTKIKHLELMDRLASAVPDDIAIRRHAELSEVKLLFTYDDLQLVVKWLVNSDAGVFVHQIRNNWFAHVAFDLDVFANESAIWVTDKLYVSDVDIPRFKREIAIQIKNHPALVKPSSATVTPWFETTLELI